MMKKFLISSIIGVLGLASCSSESPSPEPGYPIYIWSDYYMARYVEGDMSLAYDMIQGVPTVPTTLFVGWDISKEYCNPDLATLYAEYPGCLPSKPTYTEEYLQIVERNAEPRHNPGGGPVDLYYDRFVALSDNFSSIHVVSNTDWDDAHPAGTYLDDLLECHYRTYAELFKKEYSTGSFEIYSKRMDEIGPEELWIVAHYPEWDLEPTNNAFPITIRFTSPATLGQNHLLTVTMTTTDGRVKSATIAYPPKAW